MTTTTQRTLKITRDEIVYGEERQIEGRFEGDHEWEKYSFKAYAELEPSCETEFLSHLPAT